MPFTDESRRNTIGILREMISSFASKTAEHYVRSTELGGLRFEAFAKDFELFIKQSKRFSTSPVEDLPSLYVQRLREAYEGIASTLNDVEKFSLEDYGGQSAVGLRNQLVKKLDQSFDAFFDQIAPIQGFLAGVRISEDADDLRREAEFHLSTIRGEVEKAQQSKNEIVEISRVARNASLDVGVSQHARHFLTEAEGHRKAAIGWLIATIITFGLTGAAAGYNLFRSLGTTAPHDATQSVQIIVAKLILFSLLFSAVVFFGRAYRAQRHNFVVNRHRQNALSSFESFASATADTQTKNAVLVQATQSIFAPQSSGYSDQAGDAPSSPQLIELIRTVTNPGK